MANNNRDNQQDDQPIKKMDIPKNPDNKIDQDFPNYPQYPAKEEVINPQTEQQKEAADLDNKDGEKREYKKGKVDEGASDGSANAFERSENDSPLNEKDTSRGNY
jgi:hypothetical protein